MTSRHLIAIGLAALAGGTALADPPHDARAAANEQRSTLADQRGVAITIYNENLALVKDTRRVELAAGPSRLALRDVSGQLRPETAQLRSLTDPSLLDVVEQNFDFDVLTPAKLLEKSVGRTVRVARTNPSTGVETIESAQVLSAVDGVVLRIGDRIETGVPGRLVFGELPANLRDRPTLVTQVASRRGGAQTLELSYLTGGLSWRADYVAELDAGDAALDLNGWVTLDNRSGATYADAKLQLVAGDVNRVRPDIDARAKMEAMARAAMPSMLAELKQEALFEYHLYTLDRPTTLADHQAKQVALLRAAAVPVKKELVVTGSDHDYRSSAGDLGRTLKAGVFVEFDNRESAHLGQPLPKGIVRVYKRDAAGNAQFVGEDRIDHTAVNEKVRLHLGDAFDVTAERKQVDWRRRDAGKARTILSESAYEIVVKNAKRERVLVTVREPVPGDWTMLSESAPHARLARGTAEWQVSVPPEGTTTLRYRVLVRI